MYMFVQIMYEIDKINQEKGGSYPRTTPGSATKAQDASLIVMRVLNERVGFSYT